jgi:hypothetical protein
MFDDSLKALRADTPIVLNNRTCWYCGILFALPGLVRTKEHVIGRNFVPRGKLAGQWNLIGWACLKCNGRKADLENDISAITMQPDPLGRYAEKDEILISEAMRKARRSFSRRTRKLIKDSGEKITVRGQFAAGIELKFEATAGAQIESQRVYELACMQIMAFFYWLTFDGDTQTGRFWRGKFIAVLDTSRGDWGNPVMRSFMNAVAMWELSALAVTADGFFKVAIRHHPTSACWSWALEWNMKYRVIGFFGDVTAAEAMIRGFPRLEQKSILEGPQSFVRYHRDTPLAEEEDKLFYYELPPMQD